ncbi:MAG: hypothetical protein ABEJ65_05870 [bacterium]
MSSDFVEDVEMKQQQLVQEFNNFREQLSDVLFYGRRVSRENLVDLKDSLRNGIGSHIGAVREILLPALSEQTDALLNPVDIVASVQNQLEAVVDETVDKIDHFVDPEAPDESRNDAARESLKHLYRIDGLLNTYLRIITDNVLETAEEVLDEDEQEEFLERLKTPSEI